MKLIVVLDSCDPGWEAEGAGEVFLSFVWMFWTVPDLHGIWRSPMASLLLRRTQATRHEKLRCRLRTPIKSRRHLTSKIAQNALSAPHQQSRGDSFLRDTQNMHRLAALTRVHCCVPCQSWSCLCPEPVLVAGSARSVQNSVPVR